MHLIQCLTSVTNFHVQEIVDPIIKLATAAVIILQMREIYRINNLIPNVDYLHFCVGDGIPPSLEKSHGL